MNTFEEKMKEILGAVKVEYGYYEIPSTLNETGIVFCILQTESDEDPGPEDMKSYEEKEAYLKEIISRLPEINNKEWELIKEDEDYSPDDEQQPFLDTLIIHPDGSFRLGYNLGEGAAGHEYVYAHYSAMFERDDEMTFDVY